MTLYYHKKPAHVEFIGIAAAGKSLIFQEFISQLRGRGYDVITSKECSSEFLKLNKFQRHIQPLWYIFRDKKILKAFLVFFMYFFRIRPFNWLERREYCLVVKSFILENFFIRTQKTGIFTFGGAITALPGLNLSRFNNKHLIKLLDSLLINDVIRVIVFVNTPIEVAIRRAHKDPALADFRPEAFIKDTHKRQKIYQSRVANQRKLTEVLSKKSKDFQIIEVDGTKPMKENAEHIINILKREFLQKK